MRHVGIGVRLICALAMHAASANVQAESSLLAASSDGTQVSDARSKLVWSRCVEGMHWTGKTCAGDPVLASHAEALSLARARSEAEGVRWRVPRVKEFQHMLSAVERSAQGSAVLFPAAPSGWHWTVSASIDTRTVNQYDYKNIERGVSAQSANRMAFLHGWAVNMGSAEARGDVTKRTKLPVRLVRPAE